VPPFTTPVPVGMVEGLAVVKRRRSEGSVAKSLTIEIVLVVFALFSDNARAFLLMCQRAQASSSRAASHVWAAPWAIVHSHARVASRVPCWTKINLAFSWRIEIAFHLYF